MPVSGVLEKQQESLQDTLEGVAMDGEASVGTAQGDDLGPLVRALDLTSNHYVSNWCTNGY